MLLQTVAVISNCIIGMLHFPDVMRKAHAELDKVVGRERPPNFEDRNNLPYLGAIVRETLRWRPVAPLGQHGTAVDSNLLISMMPQAYRTRHLR